jgi:hypothetical protein
MCSPSRIPIVQVVALDEWKTASVTLLAFLRTEEKYANVGMIK